MASESKVIYRFKSMREPAIVKFHGNSIPLGELVARVVEDRKLSRQQADFELEVMNDQTKRVYAKEDEPIPKNSRLIIKRVSTAYGVLQRMRKKAAGGGKGEAQSDAPLDDFGGDVFSASAPDTSAAGAGMADRLAEIAQQRSQQQRHLNRQANRQTGQMAGRGLPNRSHMQMSTQRQEEQARRVNIGIPKVFLGADKEDDEGAGGAGGKGKGGTGWLRFQSDSAKFDQRVKETGGVTTKLSEDEVRKRLGTEDIPADLKCAVSGKLLKDAVVLPCCAKRVSIEDIQQSLVESSFVCPLCRRTNITADKLKPDQQLRRKVDDFIIKQREKLEQNAALDAERAAVVADKERQQRLMDKKAFHRPDEVLNLGEQASEDAEPAAQPAAGDAQPGHGDADASTAAAAAGSEKEKEKEDAVASRSPTSAAGSGWAQIKQVAPGEAKESSPPDTKSTAGDDGRSQSAVASRDGGDRGGSRGRPDNHGRDYYSGPPRDRHYDDRRYDDRRYDDRRYDDRRYDDRRMDDRRGGRSRGGDRGGRGGDRGRSGGNRDRFDSRDRDPRDRFDSRDRGWRSRGGGGGGRRGRSRSPPRGRSPPRRRSRSRSPPRGRGGRGRGGDRDRKRDAPRGGGGRREDRAESPGRDQDADMTVAEKASTGDRNGGRGDDSRGDDGRSDDGRGGDHQADRDRDRDSDNESGGGGGGDDGDKGGAGGKKRRRPRGGRGKKRRRRRG